MFEVVEVAGKVAFGFFDALGLEADLLQNAGGGEVLRDDPGFDGGHLAHGEAIVDAGSDRFGHDTLIPIRPS